MRLRITFILIFAVVAATVSTAFAVGGEPARPGDRTRVVAAFYPLAYAALQLGGNRVTVANLTPAGAEPHDLELSPADVAKVKAADLVLLLGHGFQPQLERAAAAGSGHVLTLLDASGLELTNGDPHVWLDPRRYAVLVRTIGKALGAVPAAARLVTRLGALDREFRTGLARCDRREIVTNHAAFGYLAKRYGLTQIAVEGLSPDAEPAPRDLARVVRLVRKLHATTVFTETLASPKVARTVAGETGTRTSALDPLEGLSPDAVARGADYFTVMRSNLAALREALGCR